VPELDQLGHLLSEQIISSTDIGNKLSYGQLDEVGCWMSVHLSSSRLGTWTFCEISLGWVYWWSWTWRSSIRRGWTAENVVCRLIVPKEYDIITMLFAIPSPANFCKANGAGPIKIWSQSIQIYAYLILSSAAWKEIFSEMRVGLYYKYYFYNSCTDSGNAYSVLHRPGYDEACSIGCVRFDPCASIGVAVLQHMTEVGTLRRG